MHQQHATVRIQQMDVVHHFRAAAVGVENGLQLAGDLGDGQASEVEALDPRQDGRADAAAVRGADGGGPAQAAGGGGGIGGGAGSRKV